MSSSTFRAEWRFNSERLSQSVSPSTSQEDGAASTLVLPRSPDALREARPG